MLAPSRWVAWSSHRHRHSRCISRDMSRTMVSPGSQVVGSSGCPPTRVRAQERTRCWGGTWSWGDAHPRLRMPLDGILPHIMAKKAAKKASKKASRTGGVSRPHEAIHNDSTVHASPEVSAAVMVVPEEGEQLVRLRTELMEIQTELRELEVGVAPGTPNIYSDLADSDPFLDGHPDVVASRSGRIRQCSALMNQLIWNPSEVPSNPAEDRRESIRRSVDWNSPSTLTPVLDYISERLSELRDEQLGGLDNLLGDQLARALYDLLPISPDGTRSMGAAALHIQVPRGLARSESVIKRKLQAMKKVMKEVHSQRGNRGGYWKTSNRFSGDG